MESTSAVRPVAAGPAQAVPQPVAQALQRAPHVGANVALIAVAGLALIYQLFGLPLLLRAAGGPSFALLASLVPVVLATPIHWGLIHEGIHGQLLPSRRANEAVARLLAIGLAIPFDAVRFGHLMHHRFTREAFDRPDVDDARGPRWRRRIAWYVRLLGGLYVAELLVPLLAFVPARMARVLVERGVGTHGRAGQHVQRLFANHAADPVRRRRARRDGLCSLALYGLAFSLYGKAWPVLLAAMYLRGLWLSLADNLPHYGVALDEPGRARDFRVPRGMGVMLMNHHLHRQHHLHPTLPWVLLPALACADEGASGHARMPYWYAALRQFKGLQPGVGVRSSVH
ncbi:fatty acid desaturase family protein [Paraburkholderia silviterrae]|uniref:Fatty acid desaturase n=1 Tax=Paraburkholderia silviterrae TaxID=2528715 RepID=A0A4R5MBD9_9BURK|nr:fatty acid desaturase [Paraburkholderia silviterrae]TDG24111.1 fatty acid desaturase [Paraburkholderia silviterrae]